MPIVVVIALFLMNFVALVPVALGQNVHVDMSASKIDIIGPETLRVHHLKAVGFPGTYRVDIQWDPEFVGFRFLDIVAEPEPDSVLAKTELLRGHWHFVYTIISTFTDDYALTTIPGTQNDQGGYFIHGTDQYGNPVVAAYFPRDQNWALLDPGFLFDAFYSFTTDGQTVNGCYYQVDSLGNFSRCYALSGVKTSAAASARAQSDDKVRQSVEGLRIQEQARLAIQDAGGTVMPPGVLEQYRALMGR